MNARVKMGSAESRDNGGPDRFRFSAFSLSAFL
jgi:hypothetical protein